MKKIALLLILVFLVSCGETKNDNHTDEDNAVNDESTDEVSDAVNDEADSGTDIEANDEASDEAPDEFSDETADGITDADSETTDDDNAGMFGFNIRKPIERTVSCSSGSDSEDLTQLDMDWICTFNHSGKSGYVYIQSNMTSCEIIMSASPIFTSVGSWISIDGNVSEITDANYDWGGNHHNDLLEFTYSGTKYEYYHSSFGYGWRSCQNMDCIQVGDPVTEDGCTTDRTLPAVCQEVQADGTVGDFTDSFEPCEGDSNYEN